MVDAGKVTVKVELDASEIPYSLNQAVTSKLKPAMAKAEGTVDRSVSHIKSSLSRIDSGVSSSAISSKLAPDLSRSEEAVNKTVSYIQSKLSGIGSEVSGAVSGSLGGVAASAGAAGSEAAAGFVTGFGGGIAALGTKAGPVGLALAATAGLGLAAGKVLADSVMEGMGQLQTQANVAAKIGLTPEQMAPLAAAAGAAYANNFGDSVESNLDTVQAAIQGGLLDPDANAADVQKIVAQLETVKAVTGEEIPAAVRSAQQAVRTGLAKDFTGAFDLIVAAQQRGLNVSGDLFDTINEYGTQFRKLGLDGADAMGLIQQAVKGGARDTDKAADALKEFSIRAVDGSKLTTTAFEAIGLSAKGTASAFAAGGQTARDMFQQVIDRVAAIEDPVKKAQIQVALFGTQSEDLGNALNSMNLSTAAQEFGEVGGAAQKAADTASGTAAASWEKAKRSIEVASDGIKQALAQVAAPAFQALGDWVVAHRQEISDFFTSLGHLAIDAGAFATRGIGEIIKAVGQLGAGLGNIQGAVLKFQAWQADLRGDSQTAAELRRQSEAAFSFGEGLTALGDSMATFDATKLHQALDDAAAKAKGATGETAGFNEELGKIPTDGLNVPVSVDTSAADTAMDDFFTKYRQLSVGVEVGDPAAAGVMAGTALGAGVGVRGDVAGLNLATTEVKAQQFVNNCIDAAAEIVLSASGVAASQVDIEKVIPRGGSISSLAAGLNQFNPQGRYVPMEGSGGSPEALYAAVKNSIDKGIGSVLNVAPGSSIAGTTFDAGHFIAITGYDPATGRLNLSDTADGSVYSVSTGEAFQASRGRGIVVGTGTGVRLPTGLGLGNTAGVPLDLSKQKPPPGTPPPPAAPAAPPPDTPPEVKPVTVPRQNVAVVPLTTAPTGDAVTDALQAQLDALNNQIRATEASTTLTDAAQAVADAQAASANALAKRDTINADWTKTAEERAAAEQDYQDSLKAITEAQQAQADALTDQQRTTLQDQISARQQQITDTKIDFSKLPIGDPRRAAAAALSALGAEPQDVSTIVGNAFGMFTAPAAPVVGSVAGQAAAAAAAVPLPGPLGYPGTPTAPSTDQEKLLAERNPLALAQAAGIDVPDYTRAGGGAQDVTQATPVVTANGQVSSDTAAMIDRSFTSMEAANKARHDQMLAVLNEIKAQLGEKVLGPAVEQAVTAGLQSAAAEIGKALGDAAAPVIAEAVKSAIPSQPPAQQDGAVPFLPIPGMASGGGITGGTPGKDSVPAMLMPNEWVLNTDDVARMGGFAGVSRFLSALHSSGGMRYYASGGNVGKGNANQTVGADFFGVSQIPVLGVVVNLLIQVLLQIIGVQIEQRDTLMQLTDEFRAYRGDFKAFDAAGRMYADTSGLTDRTSTSEEAAADERIRILKIVIDALVKYIIEKVIVPIGKAIGNTLISAVGSAAGAAINTQAPGAGGIVSSLITGVGSASLDIGAEIGTVVAESVISVLADAIGQALQSYFPNLTTSVFGGSVLAAVADPVSMAFATALGGIGSVLALLTDPLAQMFGGASFDSGGLASGVGLMPKATIKPERVLSPAQTASFDRLVDALASGKTVGRSSTVIHAPFTVTGGESGARVVHDRLLALTS